MDLRNGGKRMHLCRALCVLPERVLYPPATGLRCVTDAVIESCLYSAAGVTFLGLTNGSDLYSAVELF